MAPLAIKVFISYCQKSDHIFVAQLGMHVDKCNDNPCTNGGTCFATDAGNYSCTCQSNCEGRHCERCTHGMLRSTSISVFDYSNKITSVSDIF